LLTTTATARGRRLNLTSLQLGDKPKRYCYEQCAADQVAHGGDADIGEQPVVAESPANRAV